MSDQAHILTSFQGTPGSGWWSYPSPLPLLLCPEVCSARPAQLCGGRSTRHSGLQADGNCLKTQAWSQPALQSRLSLACESRRLF